MTNYRAFSISTIPYDLHREETICQIATSLAYLDQTCEHLFKRIEASMDEARDKIKSFDSRINLIDAKINKIKGSKKAIQICSSANYPVSNAVDVEYLPTSTLDPDDFYDAVKFKDYRARILDSKWKHLFHTEKPWEMKHKLHKYTTSHAPFEELAFKDKLQEFSIEQVFKYDSTGLGSAQAKSTPAATTGDGLGSVLADHIESISSLLLFNTAQHAYKQSDTRDTLLDAKKKRNIYDQDNKIDLYEAPQTILKGEMNKEFDLNSLFRGYNLENFNQSQLST